MKNLTRRNFLTNSTKATLGATLGTFAINSTTSMAAENMFVHHVYFWLKNPDKKEDLEKLIEGVTTLTKIKTIKMFHIGKPAGTTRDVIERSYSLSWLLIFDSLEDEEKYQFDPIHLKFVENYQHLWSKVIVYDSVDV